MRIFTRPGAGIVAVMAMLPLALPVAAQAAPDLKPVINSISPNPASPGAKVTVRTILRNQGTTAADLNQRRANGAVIHMVRWHFKEHGRGPDKFIMAMSMLGVLGPGQTKVLSPSPKIPDDAKPGRHTICAVSDPENRVRESNERNNRSCFIVRVSGRGGPTPGRPGGGVTARRLPDLVVRNLSVNPTTASPGAELEVKALIRNDGNAVAPGTSSGNGYMVDITLGSDTNTPAGFAAYSPNYSEDVLLKGGRFSNTDDLAPGAMKSYGDTNNQIPTDTPPGNYYVCARVDPGGKVAESNEGNNTRCVRITVRRRTLVPGRVTKVPGAAVKCPGLPAPRQIAPRNGSKFDHFPRKTKFRWSPVRNAASYGIEVDCLHCCVQGKWCSDVGRTWHVKNGLNSPQHVHNFVGAQPGRWRVWAVDACGKKSKVSGWWKFEYTR